MVELLSLYYICVLLIYIYTLVVELLSCIYICVLLIYIYTLVVELLSLYIFVYY